MTAFAEEWVYIGKAAARKPKAKRLTLEQRREAAEQADVDAEARSAHADYLANASNEGPNELDPKYRKFKLANR